GNIVAAAEHTIALALALLRRVVDADRSVRAGEWTRSKFIGRELRAKTLGLVGIGRVGGEVARRAAAFGMTVIAHDPFATEAPARPPRPRPTWRSTWSSRSSTSSTASPRGTR